MSFTCPKCNLTSYHPEDERHGYCGNCHTFTNPLSTPRKIEELTLELSLLRGSLKLVSEACAQLQDLIKGRS